MTARRTTTILASAAVLAGAFALAPTTAGGQTATCESPFSPVAFAELYPAQDELPEVPGAVVSLDVEVEAAFDSDGDGVADTVAEEPGGGLRITRGDGDVVLTAPGNRASAFLIGDIDDDGRDEFGVGATGGPGAGTFLLPGTTATGTSALADAGIRLANGTSGAWLVPDGSDRLLGFVAPTNSVVEGRTDVLDAGDVLAVGPGGDATGVTADLVLPGWVGTLADLGEPDLALISGRIGYGDPGIELFVADGDEAPGVEPVILDTRPEPYLPEYTEPVGQVEVIVGSAGTFVRLTQSSRSGAAAYLWSLTDPCTAYAGPPTSVPAGPPPTAPPAAPVAAEAAFTG